MTKKTQYIEAAGVFVAANFLLHFVLAEFFDGGSYWNGVASGGKYFVITYDTDVEISRDWFWFTYWQGFCAWAGAGFLGVAVTLKQLIESAQHEDQSDVNRKGLGLLFALFWLFFVSRRVIDVVT